MSGWGCCPSAPLGSGMVSLFAEVIAEHDRSLVGEIAAELARIPLDRRALIRLRDKGIDLAGLPPAASRELLELTIFRIAVEHDEIASRSRQQDVGRVGRRSNTMAHNLIMVAALEEKLAPGAAAEWLGPAISPLMVTRARAALPRQAAAFVALLGADAHDMFVRRRLDEMRQILVATDLQLRAARADHANAGAHPAARRFYTTLEPATAAARSRPQR